ncbi:ABC transporter substrate-binding protein [Candidatus Pelagibacter sp.]|jgi:phospholipid transport system substrate-binding protein|nr:ABC transporter substrate-binding protein [Candidatus Pelagibacter sp.]
MSSLRIIFIILISLIISKPTYAKNPSDLIKEIVDQASMILSSDDPVESKIIKLNDIAERSVDINGIGMYTLGKYRKSISEEDKSKYQKLFKSYFLKSFSSRLVDYTDPKINVVSEKKVSDKYTIVNSILEANKGRPEVKIDWRIYTKNPEKPLIRDLMVEGLSLARTQKEEFNSVIQNNNGDINSLFKVLEEFIIK